MSAFLRCTKPLPPALTSDGGELLATCTPSWIHVAVVGVKVAGASQGGVARHLTGLTCTSTACSSDMEDAIRLRGRGRWSLTTGTPDNVFAAVYSAVRRRVSPFIAVYKPAV